MQQTVEMAGSLFVEGLDFLRVVITNHLTNSLYPHFQNKTLAILHSGLTRGLACPGGVRPFARAGVFLRCSGSRRWREVRRVELGERLVLGGCCGTFVV